MKALFTFFFIAFCMGSPALAQSPAQTGKERPSHIVGFRAGANLSNFSANDPFIDPYLGYHAGIFLDMIPGKNTGFGIELNYAKQGGTINDIVISNHYLVVPVLFNLYVSEVAFQGGFYAAPLLHSQTRDPFYGYYNFNNSGDDMDLGLAIGIKRALGTAGVGLRYYHGLQGNSVNQKLELSIRLNLLEAQRKTLSSNP